MSVERSRPANPNVRKGKAVGPDYPDSNFANPWNMGIDAEYNAANEGKTLSSPSANTVEHRGVPLHDEYNELWKGK